MTEAPKKNMILKIFLWILGITGGSVLLFSFGFLLLFIILVIAGSKMVNVEKIISPRTGYTETLISGKGEDKIVVIPVTGIIQTHDTRGMFGRFNAGAQEIIRQLKRAGKDNYVKAVILNINSPGGSITASDIIYNQVLKLKASDKKIIVSMGDVSASGGYYIAAPAHKIIAHPTTITGSIGVIIQWANMESLYEKIGFHPQLIKSGAKKDMLSPGRPITEEEKLILQDIIDEMYLRFVRIVADGRQMDLEQVKALSDGRIYTGEQALENGLVDANGYFEDALKSAKELAGLEEARVVRYHRRSFFLQNFLEAAAARSSINVGVNFDLQNLSLPETPRFMYLWTGRK